LNSSVSGVIVSATKLDMVFADFSACSAAWHFEHIAIDSIYMCIDITLNYTGSTC